MRSMKTPVWAGRERQTKPWEITSPTTWKKGFDDDPHVSPSGSCHMCGQTAYRECPSCGLHYCTEHGLSSIMCIRCERFTIIALPVAGALLALWLLFVGS
jgi:hypothetical protein